MDVKKEKSRPLSEILFPSKRTYALPNYKSDKHLTRAFDSLCTESHPECVENVEQSTHLPPSINGNHSDLFDDHPGYVGNHKTDASIPTSEYSIQQSFSDRIALDELYIPHCDTSSQLDQSLRRPTLLLPYRYRQFHGRKWVFDEILEHIVNLENVDPNLTTQSHCSSLDSCCNEPVSSLINKRPVLILTGGRGSGKSSVCRQIVGSTCNSEEILSASCAELRARVLYSHFVCNQISVSFDPLVFVLRWHHSLLKRQDAIGKLYSKSIHTLNYDAETMIEQGAAETFLTKVLLPSLNHVEQYSGDNSSNDVPYFPMKYHIILLDGIDQEEFVDQIKSRRTSSNENRSILELLVSHYKYFPRWIIPLITCRRQYRDMIQKLFPDCSVVCLDDLHRSFVSHDIQQYVFHRLAIEKPLQYAFRNHLHSNTLSILRIKSSGSILYLELVLDAVKEHWISPEQLDDIPGTLNGLYLWLCQYLFIFSRQDIRKNMFGTVRPILELLLQSPTTLTLSQLYRISKSMQFIQNPNQLINCIRLLRPFLVCMTKSQEESYYALPFDQLESDDRQRLHFFHPSFAEWLTDVKLCTPEFLCSQIPTNSKFNLIEETCSHQLSLDNLTCFSTEHQEEVNQNTEHFTCDPDFITGVHSSDIPDTLRQTEPTEHPDTLHNASTISTDTHQLTSCNDSLIMISREGDASTLINMLKSRPDVNQLDEDGWSALRTAAWHGYSDIVSLLLEHGADVNLSGLDGRTALRAAAWAGHAQVVRRLLEAGADVDVQDAEGRTPLIAAAYMGHADIVELLVRFGANLNKADEDGRTALHVAAFSVRPLKNHHEVVACLLDDGANPNIADSEGITPLLGAARVGNYKICEMCLEADTDVNHMDKYGNTAVSLAILGGHADVVRLLLFWGSAVDAMDCAGHSLLSSAAALGNPVIVNELLARGLDEAHRDHVGRTPLHLAAAGPHAAAMLDCECSASTEQYCEVIRLLVENGARLDDTDNQGKTPVYIACEYLQTDILKVLIGLGMHYSSTVDVSASDTRSVDYLEDRVLAKAVNQPTLDHQTPLTVAALSNNAELMRILLAAGANPDHQDAHGRTILYLLALDGMLDMADVLLHTHAPGTRRGTRHNSSTVLGANPVLADDEGRCPLHVATWQGHVALVRLLLQAGTPADIRDREGRTPLQLAAWQGHAAVCHVLLREGNARVDAVCSQGATSLCIAAQEGHLDVCSLLIKHGANPFQPDDHGRTPYLVALKAGHHGVCQLLGQSFPQPMYDVPFPTRPNVDPANMIQNMPNFAHNAQTVASILSNQRIEASHRGPIEEDRKLPQDDPNPYARPPGPLIALRKLIPNQLANESCTTSLNEADPVQPTRIPSANCTSQMDLHMYQIYARHPMPPTNELPPEYHDLGLSEERAQLVPVTPRLSRSRNDHTEGSRTDREPQTPSITPRMSNPEGLPKPHRRPLSRTSQSSQPINQTFLQFSHHMPSHGNGDFTRLTEVLPDLIAQYIGSSIAPQSAFHLVDSNSTDLPSPNMSNYSKKQARNDSRNDHVMINPFKRKDKSKGLDKSTLTNCVPQLTTATNRSGQANTLQSKASSAKSTLVSVLGLGCNRIKKSSREDQVESPPCVEAHLMTSSNHLPAVNSSRDNGIPGDSIAQKPTCEPPRSNPCTTVPSQCCTRLKQVPLTMHPSHRGLSFSSARIPCSSNGTHEINSATEAVSKPDRRIFDHFSRRPS